MIKRILKLFVIALLSILLMSPAAAVAAAQRESRVRIELNYSAYPKQILFHMSDADEVVYGGAKGGGKSCALVMDAVNYALHYASSKIYLFRQTYDELEANLIDELFKRVPERTKENPSGLYTYDKQKHIARFDNGARIFFRYIRNVKDAHKYNGREMDYCGVDEVTQHAEEAIQVLRSCVRSPLGYPARFRATCNPGNIGHVHIKKRYITPTDYGKHTVIDPLSGNILEFIPAKVTDNMAIMQNDPAYIRRLNNLPESLRKAYRDGDWDIFEGQAFTEWDPSVHVCKHFTIPDHWRRWRSADNGYTDPFAWYCMAVDDVGRVHIYKEYTRDYDDEKVLYSDQSKKMVEMAKYKRLSEDGGFYDYEEHYDFTVLGLDAWGVNPQTRTPDKPQGKTLIDHYIEGGMTSGFVKAITDRVLRKAVWHEYLKIYPDPNNKTEEYPDGVPTSKLVIHDCCRKLIETIPEQIIDPDDPEKVAETDYDHWYDGAGYGIIAFHARKAKTVKPPKSEIQKHKESLMKARQPKRFA